MSDDQEHPGRRSGAADDRAEPDATREFAPFSEAPDRVNPDRPGDTGSGDAVQSPVPDHTAEMPLRADVSADPPDGTTIMPAADDATSVLPADPDEAAAAARVAAGRADRSWSGRAEVRPRQRGAGDLTPTDWAAADWTTAEPRESQRAWWTPILVGIVVLIILAVLGVGVWLIVQAGKDDDPGAPTVIPSAAPLSTRASTSPTSAAPTPLRTTAANTAPVEVAIPALVGLSSAEARRALDRVGLTYRLIYRPADAPPETVIDSDPPEGRQVPADTEVILVIAAPMPTSPEASPSASAAVADESGQD